jgi:serine/threonine-protein kinase HipA
MSVNRKFDGITRADLLAEADRFGVRRAEALVTDVGAAIGNWTEHAESAGLNESEANELSRDFLLL